MQANCVWYLPCMENCILEYVYSMEGKNFLCRDEIVFGLLGTDITPTMIHKTIPFPPPERNPGINFWPRKELKVEAGRE